jgi:hypothetical protein
MASRAPHSRGAPLDAPSSSRCAPPQGWRPESAPPGRPRAVRRVSALVPNLAELASALPDSSDSTLLVNAFDVGALPAARSGLRALVDGWEQAAAIHGTDDASRGEQG